jgi:hypothetical protein
MNSNLANLITLAGGVGFCWCATSLICAKKVADPKGEPKNRDVAVQDVCHRWRPADKVLAKNAGFVVVKASVAETHTSFPPETPVATVAAPAPIEAPVEAPVVDDDPFAVKPATPAIPTETVEVAVPQAPVAVADEKTTAPVAHVAKTPYGKYLNADIQCFWDTNCSNLQVPYQAIIQDILREYDNPNEQSTPSVSRIPNAPKEHDNSLSPESFKVLKEVFLWRHILDTGEEFLNSRPPKERGGPLCCVALIACLGHDIAKLLCYLKSYFVTGDHAPSSAKVIKKVINERLDEGTEKEILDAITKHHDKRGQETSNLTNLVMVADIKARERELRNGKGVTLAADQRPTSDFDSSEIMIPWLEPAEYIKALQKQINIYTNSKTYAVSSKKGVIYFTINVIYNSFKELADEKDAPEKLMYESGAERQKLLIYIIDVMRKYGAIPDNTISPGYFFARYKVTWKGASATVDFAPFRAEVFQGINVNFLERDKISQIKNIEIGDLVHAKPPVSKTVVNA